MSSELKKKKKNEKGNTVRAREILCDTHKTYKININSRGFG